TLDALDSLLETSFLKEEDTIYQEEPLEQALVYMFVHPFTATVLRESLSSARRSALHRRAADALRSRYADRLSPIAGRLFEHYRQAGQRQPAAHYAEMAGDYALTAASPAEAETFYQDALALEPSAARYLGLSIAQTRSGSIEAARLALLEALQRFTDQKDAQGILQAITYYFESYTLNSQYREAIEWVERPEIQAYASIIDPDVLSIMHSLVMAMKYRLATPSQTLMEQERINLSRLVRTTPNQAIALRVHLTLAIIFAEQGKWQEAIAAYRDFEHAAHALRDIFQEVLARNNVAYHTILLGDLEAARQEIEAVLALVKTYALSAAHFYVYSTYGELFLAEKNWSEAERWLKRALAQVKQRNDTQTQVAEVYAHLGRVAWGRGDLAAAAQRLERASSMMHQFGTPFQQTQIDLWLADLYSISEKEDAARTLLKRCEQVLEDSGWLELQRRAMQITQRLS
nr:tetratricopeptide repeat protein [Ktedonobacteraceae bacterium]